MRPTKSPWAKKWCAVIALVWRCDARLSLPFSRNGRRPLPRRVSFSRQTVDDLASASDMSFGLVFSFGQASAWAGTARPAASAAAAMAIRRRFRVRGRVMREGFLRDELPSPRPFGAPDPGLKRSALVHTSVQFGLRA